MTTTNDTTTALEHQVGPRGRFLLRQTSGEVAIRGVEGDRVRVRTLDGRPLGDRFTVEAGEGSLEIRAIERLSFSVGGLSFSRKEGAELAIEVPHGATVSVETQSADIEATDLSGSKKFRTASGEVTLSRLAGALDVETVSGEIELDGQAPVDLVAKSVSGDIRVRVPSLRRLDLGTTSGDIRLDAELAGDGPFAIRSISGDATIVGRSGFRVEVETITGDVSSDPPSKRESMHGRKVLTIGRPGATLSFRSVSGDFHVAGPRDAAPAAPPLQEAEATTRDREVRNCDQEIPADAAASSDTDATRLEILRALERGEISVADATEQLRRLDEVLR
jgi:DUF4097 and DUF4098 domain-containing protein YvlB